MSAATKTVMALALVLSGCCGIPECEFADLSGTYRFDAQHTTGGRVYNDLPLQFSFVLDGSEVIVTQDGWQSVSITYIDHDEQPSTLTYSTEDPNTAWDSGALIQRRVVPHVGAPIFPGWAKVFLNTRVFVNDRRNLVLHVEEKEAGLMLFLIPFQDRYSSQVVLERVEPRPDR